jgi:hypothetical protein
VIASPPLAGSSLLSRAKLDAWQRDEMFELLSRHFEGVTRTQFERDLVAKQWVIALRQDDRLVGFSTLRATTSRFDGAPITVIYSGDTIVSPEAWGTPALARAWIAGVNHLRTRVPEQRCFWLLLTSGFRTYRFLPVFWRDFFPRFDASTPPAIQQLLVQLAREGYGSQFDAATGVVRFSQPQRLRGRLAEVPAGRDANPHVGYFLARNPHHHRGDELVCITEISEHNMTAAGRRMVSVQP